MLKIVILSERRVISSHWSDSARKRFREHFVKTTFAFLSIISYPAASGIGGSQEC
jgi:hypothetical protein